MFKERAMVLKLSTITEQLWQHGVLTINWNEHKGDLMIIDDCGAEMIDVEPFVDE
jgi:hypothetical protein